MKISEKWLREWVNPEVDTRALIEQLTIAGLEVDGQMAAAGDFTDVVIAEVTDIQPHPDADKLQVCQVNDANGELKQVVCGAANVRVGMRVPFARVGAQLADDIKIKKVRLRGVESCGMLCSEQELGMAESADGLMELPNDAPLGTGIREYLDLDDQIIELDLTPNRGDCLSIMGVARDVAAINGIQFEGRTRPSVSEAIIDTLPIYLDAPEACSAYSGRVIRGINADAPTPLWMREKLRRSGIRCLHPVVDVTNYIMLELGQPMHAFDLDKLNGSIHVRMAKSGEKLVLLDGKEIEAREDILLIADDKQPLAMAGIMGGWDSAVDNQTTNIFLESAYFNPLNIAGCARSYGLHTDSSHRFERGVDPQLQSKAMQHATKLLQEIVGGQAGPVTQIIDQKHLPKPVPIKLRSDYMQRLLGVELSTEQIETYLGLLNIEFVRFNNQWAATPPSYRFDLTIEADLIEEIARLYGYNKLPQSRPEVLQSMVGTAENRLDMDYFKNVLAQRGWQEAITYSFVDPDIQQVLSPDRMAINLSNPISSEMSQMRTSHWSGLLQALSYNQNRQQHDVRLFECGLNFIAKSKSAENLEQKTWISGIAAGRFWPEHWSSDNRPIDFYDIKGDLEAMLEHTRVQSQFTFVAETHPALHPGQSARIYRSGEAVGWLGALHPEIEDKLSVTGPVFLFEIRGEALFDAQARQFAPVSRYPSVRRDLALVVDIGITAAQIRDVISNTGQNTIQNISIFDVYQGKGIESERKSVALGLILQDYSRTLTDEEVEEVVSTVIAALGKKLGAVLRD